MSKTKHQRKKQFLLLKIDFLHKKLYVLQQIQLKKWNWSHIVNMTLEEH